MKRMIALGTCTILLLFSCTSCLLIDKTLHEKKTTEVQFLSDPIMTVTQTEDEMYTASVEIAFQNTSASDYFNDGRILLSFYDEDDYLIGTLAESIRYIGKGETARLTLEKRGLGYFPASVKVSDFYMEIPYDNILERENKANVKCVGEERFSVVLQEDGLYHVTLEGEIENANEKDSLYVVHASAAFYDSEGILRGYEWGRRKENDLLPVGARGTYYIEYVSEVEIASYVLIEVTGDA